MMLPHALCTHSVRTDRDPSQTAFTILLVTIECLQRFSRNNASKRRRGGNWCWEDEETKNNILFPYRECITIIMMMSSNLCVLESASDWLSDGTFFFLSSRLVKCPFPPLLTTLELMGRQFLDSHSCLALFYQLILLTWVILVKE